jgi:hypothetical protein
VTAARGWLAFLATVLLARGGTAADESLGAAADKERDRRAKVARPPARSYGDADLRGRGQPATTAPSPSPSPSPGARAGATPAPPPEEAEAEDESVVRKRQEMEWRLRFAQARERVAREEAASWRSVVETVYVSGIPVQQWVRKFEETEELREARQAFADLEEEFRRTGLPPGWARVP